MNAAAGAAPTLPAPLQPWADAKRLQVHVADDPARLPSLASAAVAAARRDGGIVVAIGGDGTLNTVAHAAWHADVPFACIPAGTFNFFGRAHGIPEDADEAANALLAAVAAGRLAPVAVAQVQGQLFLVNASLGLYPRLLLDREAAKARFGRFRVVALLSAIVSLWRPTFGRRLHWTAHDADGRVQRSAQRVSTLFVGQNALQWETVGLVSPDDAHAVGRGTLGVLAVPPLGRRETLAMLWRAARGRLHEMPRLERFECTRLDIRGTDRWSSRPLRVAYDGETRRMTLPLRIECASRPLWLVGP